LKSFFQIRDQDPSQTLAERRKKREIEDLKMYAIPPLNKKRKIKKPLEIYTTGHRRKRGSEDLAVYTMSPLNKRRKIRKPKELYRDDF
jgi:hypothetical protein